MSEFVKKHWPLFALFIAAGAIMFLMQALDAGNDDAIARLMADRAVSRLRARVAALDAKYAALNAAKDAATAAAIGKIKADSAAEVARFRKRSDEAQAKVKTLEGCAVLLDECQQFVVDLQLRCVSDLDASVALCNERIALKDAELAERRALETEHIDLIGTLTKRIVKLEAWKRRKLVIGPQAGYGPGGAYVGAGVTYEVIRIKAPGQ